MVDDAAIPTPAPTAAANAPPHSGAPPVSSNAPSTPVASNNNNNGSDGAGTPSSSGVPPSSASPGIQYSATRTTTQIDSINAALQCPDAMMNFSQGVVPTTASVQQQSKLPFGVSLHPMHPSTPVPLVPLSAPHGIVRCRQCRAYVNPFVEWLDGGRRWRCNLCTTPNDTPGSYFSPLDAQGIRTDIASKPELHSGVVDFVAPAEYMVRPPMAPAYLFVLDVSYYALSSGMTYSAVRAIKEALPYLAGGDRTRVGFMTFDSTVQFFSFASASSDNARMICVGDLDDENFVPVVADSVLVSLGSRRAAVDKLIATLEDMFSPAKGVNPNAPQDTCLGPALRMAHDVGKQWGCRILCFTASIAKRGKDFGFSNREQELGKLIGADNESTLFRGHGAGFENLKKLAAEMSKVQTCCDVFSFAPYVDLASIGVISQITGGQLYYYGAEVQKTDQDREKLFYDVFYALTKEQFWEGVMRLRCSRGVAINPGAIFGNFHVRSSDLMALPCVDSEKGFTFLLKVEESLTAIRRVSFQVALLYTSSNHERRIRVLNKCLPVSSSLADVFRTAKAEVLADIMFKTAVKRAIDQRVPQAREALINSTADMLHVYKTTFSANMSSELVIPESLKMLPLYALGMIKHPVLRVAIGERVDRRVQQMFMINCMPFSRTVSFLYPTVSSVHSTTPLRLSLQAIMEAGGVALIDNSMELILYVARAADVNILAHVFAVTSFDQVDPRLPLPEVDSPISKHVLGLVAAARAKTSTWSKLSIVREGDPRTNEVLSMLIEDRMNLPPLPSFQDFVRQLQTQVAKGGK